MSNIMRLRRMRFLASGLRSIGTSNRPLVVSGGGSMVHQRVAQHDVRAHSSLRSQWTLSTGVFLALSASAAAIGQDNKTNDYSMNAWCVTLAEKAHEEHIEYERAVKLLHAGITEVRANLKRNPRVPQDFPVPTLKLSRAHAPNGVSTIRIEFNCPSGIDRDTVVVAFLEKLNPSSPSDTTQGDGIGIQVLPTRITRTNATDSAGVQYVYTDGTGSFHFLQDPSTPSLSSSFVFYKDEFLTHQEVDAVLHAYKELFTDSNLRRFRHFEMGQHNNRLVEEGVLIQSGRSDSQLRGAPDSKQMAIRALQKLGIDVYQTDHSDNSLTWDSLAGYEQTKREIEDTIVLALQNPEVYEKIAKQTRCRYESNRPRAVLFEGPPGTGKTLTARIIAHEAGIPMIHVPIESVVSKWYGDSEKKMSSIFDAVEKLDGAIIFIDEIDALAGNRSDQNMHEASRRILSVLLQKVEGFASAKKTTVICATNRKQDLDMALISRFDLCIRYELPDEPTRKAVFHRYAKQLESHELEELATVSAGFSCRDIKEVCEYAERKWASKLLKKEETSELPRVSSYLEALRVHVTGVGHSHADKFDETMEA